MEKNDSLKDQPLIRPLSSNMNSIFTKKFFILLIAAIAFGAMTGYVFSGKKTETGSTLDSGLINSSEISKGTVVGSNDTKLFKDIAAGDLKGGGINGEGQFHLVRPGGESQNVYVTSSTVDLSQFIGKKIKVWGQTQKAQHAGWLMDVGRVEVTE